MHSTTAKGASWRVDIVNGNDVSDYRYFKYFLNAFRDKLHLSIQEEASTMGDLTTVTTF